MKKRELTVREIQNASLEVLNIVASICEKQKFRYFLIFGTLLGAIRHKGFIPWDDDVDIMMPRPDYEKLLVFFSENIDDYPNLRVFNRNTCKEYPYMITRISDDRYEIEMDNERSYGMGVFIDIYPFDGVGDKWEDAKRVATKGDWLSSMCFQSTRLHFTFAGTESILKRLIKYPAYVISKLIGKDFFQDKLSNLENIKEYDQSKYVCCVIWMTNGERELFARELFDSYEMAPFDKYNFRIPKAYDKILTQNYGDYMKLPSEEDRIGHHFYKMFEK